jgi:DNA-directed RNA polymerase subunit RPC12/RpoP
MSVVCKNCGTAKWKIKRKGLFHLGKKIYTCVQCGKEANFDVWVNDEYVGPKDHDPKEISGENQYIRDFKNDKTSCCGAKTDRLIEGPSGGMSTNFKCDACGQKWNITFILGGIHSIEKI